ncbi:MAG: ORF2 [Hubei mamastrovirus 1]|nr:MAG: ORF2 [Hubei mamastrovirus 1]
MANRQQKSQPRTTTKIVVRNGAAANQAGPSRAQQARRRRNRRKPQVNIRVLANQNKNIRRNPRRPAVGSRVVFQKITSTLGTVGSNNSEQIECELTVLLNPATMKETTGVNTFGPLGIYASTYALWKMTRCELRLKPLVGDSAVSGTVIRASWNPTSTPSQTSWSALGARLHADVTPGKTGRFVLTSKNLKGPKDGWYKTNTKGDPMMCFAGTLEIHTLGRTMSTYRGEHFPGGLFLAELVTEWQFKDYQQQPGMFNLLKGEDKNEARVEADPDGKLQLIVPPKSRMAKASSGPASEIIWLVTDTIVQVGTQFLGPFGWLIRGGWWLIKRAANAPVRTDGGVAFDIYSSISDARAGVPCLNGSQRVEIPVGGLHFQQITPGNTGADDNVPMGRALDYPLQPTPPSRPTKVYVTKSTMFRQGTRNDVPSACVWYNNNGGQNHTNKGVGFECGGKVCSFTVHRVEVHTDVGPATPEMFEHKIQFKLFNPNPEYLGKAVASTYTKTNDSPNVWMSHVLVYVDYTRSQTFHEKWDVTEATYPTTDYKVRVTTRKAQNQFSDLHLDMRQGGWYIVVYAVYGRSLGDYKVGDSIIATKGSDKVHENAHDYALNTILSGNGFPAYMTGLTLTPFTTSDVVYSGTSRDVEPSQTLGHGDLDPSFGCDDVFEFPPPPAEEDLADEACGFEPFSDSDAENFEDPEEDEDEELELGPDDDYSDPPISRLVVHPDAQQLYDQLRANHSEREARLAVNQLYPSDEYTEFTEVYHDALADGLSPKEARAQALGF